MRDDDDWNRVSPPRDENGKVRGAGKYMAWIGDDAVAEVEREDTHCYREKLDLPDGTTVETFLCGRLGPPCACGAVSEVLCDFPIGDEERTCDKPCCLRCAPTVGVDKNFCPEHMAAGAGENMLLFKRPPRMSELVEEAQLRIESEPVRRPRLERAPPPTARFRVVYDDGTGTDLATIRPIGFWTTREKAEADRAKYGFAHFVQTWDEYVALFRKKYPPKPRKPRPPRPKR